MIEYWGSILNLNGVFPQRTVFVISSAELTNRLSRVSQYRKTWLRVRPATFLRQKPDRWLKEKVIAVLFIFRKVARKNRKILMEDK